MKGEGLNLQSVAGAEILWYFQYTEDSRTVITVGKDFNLSIHDLDKQRSGIYSCHGYNIEKTKSYLSRIKVIFYGKFPLN